MGPYFWESNLGFGSTLNDTHLAPVRVQTSLEVVWGVGGSFGMEGDEKGNGKTKEEGDLLATCGHREMVFGDENDKGEEGGPGVVRKDGVTGRDREGYVRIRV